MEKRKRYVLWFVLGFVGLVIVLILFFGMPIEEAAEHQRILTEQAQIEDTNKPISRSKALSQCNKKAKECSDGIFQIELTLRNACREVPTEDIVKFAEGMC